MTRISPRAGTRALLLCAILLPGVACVEWRHVPDPAASARPLPRSVQVTTRDSVRYRLKDAHIVPGDTLVGRPTNAAAPVRLPVADIAHLEARMHNTPHSLAMLAVATAVAYKLFSVWARGAYR